MDQSAFPGEARFRALTSVTDELLWPWLDLYETAFPPSERVLVSNHLAALAGRAIEPGEHHLLAALTGEEHFAGLARYQALPEAGIAHLWYLAVAPALRGAGLGAQFYAEIVRRARQPGMRALALEVEMPELARSDEERALAQRRIAFYRRAGALVLQGVRYTQYIGPHQPPLPMHLMFHPFAALDGPAAFELGRTLFGEWLVPAGAARLA